MHWTWTRFEELGVQGLYEVLALRCRVFVLEQGAYLDPDGLDAHSWHLQGRDDAGVRCRPTCAPSIPASSTSSRRSAGSLPHPKCAALAWAAR